MDRNYCSLMSILSSQIKHTMPWLVRMAQVNLFYLNSSQKKNHRFQVIFLFPKIRPSDGYDKINFDMKILSLPILFCKVNQNCGMPWLKKKNYLLPIIGMKKQQRN